MDDAFAARLAALPGLDQAGRNELARHGVRSPEVLLALVQDRAAPTPVRSTACWVAGMLRDRRAVDALLTAFQDPAPELVRVAAHALVLLGNRRAVPPLIVALGESADPHRREAAAYALGHLNDKRALAPLLDALITSEQGVGVRAQAAESLGYLRDERAVEPLIAALRDPEPAVRYWATFAHGWLRDRRALPALRRLAAEDTAEVDEWGSVSNEAAATIPDVEQGWSES